MNNKTLLTITMIAGLAFGGLSAGAVASAQGYGDNDGTSNTEIVVEGDTSALSDIVLAQDGVDSETDGDREGRRGHRGGCSLEEAAAAIGIDEAALKTALDGGDTIADVAEANGVDVDTVIDAMVNAQAEHIREKVADGRLTQEEADAKLADAERRVTARVNGTDGDTEA